MGGFQIRTAEQDFRQALEAQQAGRYEQAVQLLARAGSQDHVLALSMLGGQLMSGRGVKPDFASGLTLMRRAAELGGPYACAVLAATYAYGLGAAPDWTLALDQLQRAAELGDESAQTQLRLLAERNGPVPGQPSWAALRAGVGIETWRSPPAAEVLSADPDIRIVPGLAPAAMCDWLISKARERLHPTVIHNPTKTEMSESPMRTGSAATFHVIDADLVTSVLRERLAAAAGLDVSQFESPQVLHYGPGQFYKHHFDFLEPELPGNVPWLHRYGQRVATLLVYLNDGFEGGETDFPRLNIRYKGRAGDALLFRNVDAAGAPDRRMLHAGLPPTSGEKWLFSQWVRDRAQ